MYIFPCLLYENEHDLVFFTAFLFLYERPLIFWAYPFFSVTGSLLPPAICLYAVEDIPCFPVFSYPGVLSLSTRMLARASQS